MSCRSGKPAMAARVDWRRGIRTWGNLGLGQSHQLPVFELVYLVRDDPLAGAQAARHFDAAVADRAGGDAAHRDTAFGVDDRDAAVCDGCRRKPDPGWLLQFRVASLRLQERDSRAHLRQQTVAWIEDLYLDLDDGLGPVGRGNDLPQHAAPLLSGEGVDADLGRLSFAELGDAAFVDVRLDFESVEVNERTDGSGRERAGDLAHHDRRDHFTDLGVLRGDRAVERRAHHHVLHVDLDLVDAGERGLVLRVGAVQQRFARDALFPERRLPVELA